MEYLSRGFSRGVEGEKLDEAEAGDSVIPPIEPDYEKDGTNNDDEKDSVGYTNLEHVSLQIIAEANIGATANDNDNDDNVIGVVDDDNDDNNGNDNVEKQEKDEAFYQREERALKRATLLSKLRKHNEEARSIRKPARILVQLAKEGTTNNVEASKIRIVIIVDFYQIIQISSFLKDQPGAVYCFVPLNIYCLGIVDYNSIKDHLHAYMYSKAEGERGGNEVATLIIKYLSDKGYLNGTT